MHQLIVEPNENKISIIMITYVPEIVGVMMLLTSPIEMVLIAIISQECSNYSINTDG